MHDALRDRTSRTVRGLAAAAFVFLAFSFAAPFARAQAALVMGDMIAFSVTLAKPADGATLTGTSQSFVATTVGPAKAVTFAIVPDPALGISTINLTAAQDSMVPTQWTATWNTVSAPNGQYAITATADAAGDLTANSATVKTTVANVVAMNPTVTSPKNGDTVSGSAGLAATTGDKAESLQFVITGSGAPAVVSASGDGKNWSAKWDSTAVENGPYTVVARAWKSATFTDGAPVNVKISNATSTFAVTIGSPKGGETVSGGYALSATTNETSTSVSFAVKTLAGAPVATVPATSGDGKTWTAKWDSTGVANAAYTVEADALKTGGSANAFATFTVNNVVPITVAVTVPTAAAVVTGTQDLVAATGVTVATLEFHVLGSDAKLQTIAGASADGMTWKASWDTRTTANGAATVTALAKKDSGSKESAGVAVTVKNDASPLTVALTSPANGVTLVGTASFVATTNLAAGTAYFEVRAAAAAADSAPLATFRGTGGSGNTVWSGLWDTTGVPDGKYAIVPVAVKDAQTAKTAPTYVVVSNGSSQPPVTEPLAVVLTTPAPAASVIGKVTLAASANQALDGLTFVITGGSEPLKIPATGNTLKTAWSAPWDSSGLPNGDYVAVAVGTRAGKESQSAPAKFTVGNTSVSVTLAAPTNGATLSGPVTVAAAAIPAAVSVGVVITGVDDGSRSERAAKYDSGAQLWSFLWGTADFKNGKYRLDATGLDADGHQYAAAPVTVTVSNGGAPPPFAVRVVVPAEGDNVYGHVPLVARTDGDAAAVKFYVSAATGGGIVAVQASFDAGRGAWVGSWDATAAPNGPYVVGVVATNAKNVSVDGPKVAVNLRNAATPQAPPAAVPLGVKLVAPAEGGVSGKVQFVAVAEGGATNVGVAIRRTGVDAPALTMPATFDREHSAWNAFWDTTPAPVGTYIAVAVAMDANGHRAESNAVTMYIERHEETGAPAPAPGERSVMVAAPPHDAVLRGLVPVAGRAGFQATKAGFAARGIDGKVVFTADAVWSKERFAWVGAWDTTTVPDGKYALSFTAIDAGGAVTAAIPVAVDNASAGPVERVDAIAPEVVRDSIVAQPPGTRPIARDQLPPPPKDVQDKILAECAAAGVGKDKCDAWQGTRGGADECRAAGILTKEECVAYLKKQHGGQLPGCDGNAAACAEAMVRRTAGLATSEELDVVKKIVLGSVGHSVRLPPRELGAPPPEGDHVPPPDIAGLVPLRPRDGVSVLIQASPASEKLDDATTHETVPGVVMIDTDGDGLPDDVERRIGTDPNNPDTDGDGFDDGTEIKTGHNPLGRGALVDGVKLAPIDVAIVSGAPLQQPKNAGARSADLEVEHVGQKPAAEGDKNPPGINLTGRAKPGDTITIFVYSYLPVVLTTKADENGDWSYDLDTPLDDGRHEAYVTVTDDTGTIKEKSGALPFFVAAAQAATSDAYFAPEKAAQAAEASPTVAAAAAAPVKQSFAWYALGAVLLVALALVIAAALMFGGRKKPPQAPTPPR